MYNIDYILIINDFGVWIVRRSKRYFERKVIAYPILKKVYLSNGYIYKSLHENFQIVVEIETFSMHIFLYYFSLYFFIKKVYYFLTVLNIQYIENP